MNEIPETAAKPRCRQCAAGLRQAGRRAEFEYAPALRRRDVSRQAFLFRAADRPVQAAQRLEPARGNRRRAGRDRRRDAESFSPGERAMLNNILRLREVRVEDVMVPRADVEAVEITTTLGELMVLFEQSGPFAHAGLFRDARRSARHGPHPRRAGPHHAGSPATKKGRATEEGRPPAADARLRQCRSVQDHRRAEPDPHRCCSCRRRCWRPT